MEYLDKYMQKEYYDYMRLTEQLKTTSSINENIIFDKKKIKKIFCDACFYGMEELYNYCMSEFGELVNENMVDGFAYACEGGNKKYVIQLFISKKKILRN